jgi:hypothetical protein
MSLPIVKIDGTAGPASNRRGRISAPISFVLDARLPAETGFALVFRRPASRARLRAQNDAKTMQE